MKRFSFFIVLSLCVFSLGCFMGLRGCREATEMKSDTVVVSDTIRMVDTIKVVKPTLVSRLILDTVEVRINDTVYSLYSEQRVYQDSDYTAWVSGYNPSLDSINVVRRVERITEMRTITSVVEDMSAKCYIGASIDKYDKTYIPKIRFSVAKNSYLIGLSGGYGDGGFCGGIDFNLKIK